MYILFLDRQSCMNDGFGAPSYKEVKYNDKLIVVHVPT